MRELFNKSELDKGMLRVNTPPHTREVRHLESCCNAVVTSCYWFLCKYFDESIESELVLSELSKLQDTDMDSNAYGCMK